ncbi:MAG: flippase-like domain-containing protein [Candidatus Rokubacteria bacterium]|nr:flippase-like domain-containing protein [Candidatus Rokubacteria bacterium]
MSDQEARKNAGRSWLFRVAKGLAGLALFGYVAGRIGVERVLGEFRAVSIFSLVVAVCVMVGGILVTSRRWQVIIQAQGTPIPFAAVLRVYLVGLFFNLAGAGGLGGYVYRVISLTKYTSRAGISAVSLVVDRGMDAIILPALALLGLGGYGFVKADWPLMALAIAGLPLYASLVYGGARLGGSLTRKVGSGTPWFRGWPTFLEAFTDGIFRLRDHPALRGKLLGLSVLFQCWVIMANFVISWSLRFDIPLWQFVAFMPLIAIINLFPLTFNGLGVLQVAYVYFFGLGGVEPSKALTLSVVVVLGSFLLAGLGGLLFGWECLAAAGARGRAGGDSMAPKVSGREEA